MSRNSIWPPSALFDLFGKSWDDPRRPIHGGSLLQKFRHDLLISLDDASRFDRCITAW